MHVVLFDTCGNSRCLNASDRRTCKLRTRKFPLHLLLPTPADDSEIRVCLFNARYSPPSPQSLRGQAIVLQHWNSRASFAYPATPLHCATVGSLRSTADPMQPVMGHCDDFRKFSPGNGVFPPQLITLNIHTHLCIYSLCRRRLELTNASMKSRAL